MISLDRFEKVLGHGADRGLTLKELCAITDLTDRKVRLMVGILQKNGVPVINLQDGNGYYTKPVKAMVCSVGLDGKTETGTFTIKAQQGKEERYKWRQLVGGVWGQYAVRFNGSILFHSVPYHTNDKGKLETEEYNKLGQAASAGCVRLAVIDAKWIYDNCPTGTTVEVYDSSAQEPLAKPTPIKIDLNDSRKGWDPTDPDPNNPW